MISAAVGIPGEGVKEEESGEGSCISRLARGMIDKPVRHDDDKCPPGAWHHGMCRVTFLAAGIMASTVQFSPHGVLTGYH